MKDLKRRAAGIFFTDGKQVLLLKRADGSHQGTWGLPGGHSKEGETPQEAAERETMEETGLDTIPGSCFKSLEDEDEKGHFTTYLYEVGGPFDCQISDEHSSWKWFPLAKVKSLDLHPALRENMDRYLVVIRKNLSKSFKEWVSLRSA